MLATSAAPGTFLPHIRLDDEYGIDAETEYIDGALYNQDPTLVAILEAEAKWPGRKIHCVHSIATYYDPDTKQKRDHGTSCMPTLAWGKQVIDIAFNEDSPVQGRAQSILNCRHPNAKLRRILPEVPGVGCFESSDAVIQNMVERCNDFLQINATALEEMVQDLDAMKGRV